MLANILGISNDGSHVFEMKVIPTIEGYIYIYIYDEALIIHTGKENSAAGVKIN